MKIDAIKNGFVIDHITAGRGMELYRLLKLDQLDCPVAIIQNVTSKKLGRKDIIKIDGDITIDMDILGYVDPDVTVDIIKDSVLVEKRSIDLPEELRNVIFCKNPRCITTTEQELPHIFRLTDKEKRIYRCRYCETKAK
ncbi:MAG: aspartate carbamoyltransferase regulatory subunit [Clostridia bacterium]|nr:aspartate carbamoyltransferase regulatory subunit [Clostridia bacterium]